MKGFAMKKTIKEKAISAKNHVVRHRAKYAALATLIVMLELQQISNRQWTEFLVEKGIDPLEFFVPEEYFEKLHS
jgi:hypothetical protein